MTTPPESYITELKKLPTRFDVKNFKPMNLEVEDPFTEDEWWDVKVQKCYYNVMIQILNNTLMNMKNGKTLIK